MQILLTMMIGRLPMRTLLDRRKMITMMDERLCLRSLLDGIVSCRKVNSICVVIHLVNQKEHMSYHNMLRSLRSVIGRGNQGKQGKTYHSLKRSQISTFNSWSRCDPTT